MPSEERLDAIFEKTRGRCHICRKQLARSNYGDPDGQGSWEVDHSKPKAEGGTNHLNNLFPICTNCNREKGDSRARTARSEHGYSRPPLSKKEYERKRTKNTAGGGLVGAAVGAAVVGTGGALALAGLGMAIGASAEPEAE